mmetsp:Transcript_3475/g.6524  ORF Transcript_3475/g.6524 Transcript_3475/m.6524 type:complete len:281 (-) Transcript_3475:1533-2375(-)
MKMNAFCGFVMRNVGFQLNSISLGVGRVLPETCSRLRYMRSLVRCRIGDDGRTEGETTSGSHRPLFPEGAGPGVSPPGGGGDEDESFESSTPPTVSYANWVERFMKDPKWDDFRTFTASFAVALFVRFFVMEPRFIPSTSMFPTFDIGDQLLVEKVSNLVKAPEVGDVVVFKAPDALVERGFTPSDVFIKRVVGAEGDKVFIKDGEVFVNGIRQDETFTAERPNYEWGPATVPSGSVMVLGDNRNNSFDSHLWGFLPRRNIIGKAVLRYWPLTRVGFIER